MYGLSDHAEAHPLHAVQRAPARLFAILDPHHGHMIEHMFDHVERRRAGVDPPAHLPLPTRPGPRPLLPAAGRRRLDCSSTRASGCPDAQETWARGSSTGRRSRGSSITHFHPDHVGGAADVAEPTGAPVYQGALDYAQCEPCGGTTTGRSGSPPGSARTASRRRSTDELIEAGHVYRPFVRYAANPELVDDGRRGRRLGGVASCPVTPTATSACSRRRARRGRPPPRADHAGRRALSGEPARSARRLPRVARADDRARAARSLYPGTASRSTTRPAARAS